MPKVRQMLPNPCPWIVKDILRTAKNKKSDHHSPMNLLKCTDACVIPLTDLINNTVSDCLWPVQLGFASITLAHKKSSRTDKGNYRLISVLPSISKIFEKLLHDQLSKYMEDKLSPLLCGF